ncbi:hypothetical protein [Streptomyces sp. WAC08241]|uniref:hypothetical protein n=1 Tax=Streptomyces sp. WAC08241 TaxID=2487421 RepID=UPI0021AF9B33|nr:hypothetical protein [Streptomyces sp. WAC08241]
MHLRRERELAAATWLLLSARDAKAARHEWATYGVALLRCGALFSAVRMPAGLVHAAADSEGREEVAHFLDVVLRGGPVIHDAGGRQFYALTPASTARYGQTAGAECLGSDSLLGVPATDVTEPDPRRSAYWVVPMDGPGTLCVPGAVAKLVGIGRDALDRAEGEGEGDE